MSEEVQVHRYCSYRENHFTFYHVEYNIYQFKIQWSVPVRNKFIKNTSQYNLEDKNIHKHEVQSGWICCRRTTPVLYEILEVLTQACRLVRIRGMTRYWSTYQTTSGLFSLLLFSLLLTTPTWCIVSYSLLQVYSVYMGTHMYMYVCVHIHIHVYYMYLYSS